MKFFTLIFANLLRKKSRFFLTIGSFTVALFLFAVLTIVRSSFSRATGVESVNRLVVTNRISITQPLPLSYQDRILRIPGVEGVTFDVWFGAIYQEEKNFFPQFAIDTRNQRKVFPELAVPEDQWQNFINDREGAIAGAATAKRFGWKIGQRIPLRGTFVPGNWEFNLDGIYHSTSAQAEETQFWFQWDRLSEALNGSRKGQIGWYTVRVANPDLSARVAKQIDTQFANSFYETRTETEATFAVNWMKQTGNIGLLVITIGGVVLFTLLLVTGNTMAMSVRERTSELAVLKALGYSNRIVLMLVLAESVVISVLGGSLGLLLAKLSTFLKNPTRGLIPFFQLHAEVIWVGLAVTFIVGAVSGSLPAIAAMRLRVVDALRRV
jgi:putative ABC transport system permease protein